MNARTLPYVLILVLPLVVYGNSLGNPFHYDDGHSIVANPHIRNLANIPRFFIEPTLFSAEAQNAMYRPLLLCSFALNHAVSGYQPWSYHLVGILLHIGCIYWIYRLGQRLLAHDTAALAAALVFGLHPINSEALNYISSRSELLAVFFFLTAFWAYIERRRTVLVLAFAAGLLSKSVVITLPALMGCYALYDKRAWRREAWAFGLVAGVAAGYLAVVRSFLYKASIAAPVRGYHEQVWTQVKALVLYLKLLVQPVGLTVDHQFLLSASLFEAVATGSALLLVSLFAVAVWGWRHQPLPALLCAWFVLALAPASIIPLNVLVNEHRLYLASGAFALGGGTLVRAALQHRSQVHGAVVALVVILGILTVERNTVWASTYRLWEDAAARAPMMARPWIFLAEAHQADGHADAAIQAYRQVLRRDPQYGPAYAALAELYLAQGQVAAADTLCRAGLARVPSALLWSRLAEVYRHQAQQAAKPHDYAQHMAQSAAAYRAGLALDATDPAIHNNLGNTYQVLGQYDRALKHHQQALELAPEDARTLVNLGNAWLAGGQPDAAETAYQRAIALEPQYAGAWLSLGNLHQQRGRYPEAVQAYQTALRFDPTLAATVARRQAAMEAEHD